MADDYDDQDDRSYPMDDDVDILEIIEDDRPDFGIYDDDDSDGSDDE